MVTKKQRPHTPDTTGIKMYKCPMCGLKQEIPKDKDPRLAISARDRYMKCKKCNWDGEIIYHMYYQKKK